MAGLSLPQPKGQPGEGTGGHGRLVPLPAACREEGPQGTSARDSSCYGLSTDQGCTLPSLTAGGGSAGLRTCGPREGWKEEAPRLFPKEDLEPWLLCLHQVPSQTPKAPGSGGAGWHRAPGWCWHGEKDERKPQGSRHHPTHAHPAFGRRRPRKQAKPGAGQRSALPCPCPPTPPEGLPPLGSLPGLLPGSPCSLFSSPEGRALVGSAFPDSQASPRDLPA